MDELWVTWFFYYSNITHIFSLSTLFLEFTEFSVRDKIGPAMKEPSSDNAEDDEFLE